VAVEDGYRESGDSWYEVWAAVLSRGITCGPQLAIGDGALGFWKALTRQYPDTVHQRCWLGSQDRQCSQQVAQSFPAQVEVSLG
jgi:transposase-like protein